jgi:hypothetical protein
MAIILAGRAQGDRCIKRPMEAERPAEVQQVIARIRLAYHDVKWTRLSVTHPGADDDGIWFFWLPNRPGGVQIESSFGVCPFLVETDKHNECFTGVSVQEVAEKVVEWLALPGGHAQAFGIRSKRWTFG